MRMMLAAAFAACLLAASSAGAYQPAPPPDEAQLQEHGHYRNRDGDEVHSPAHTKDGRVPEGASAKCRDGSYSFSRHRSGTCSHHGGVAEWE
jgi:opacity protein-like surface antigen